MGAAPGRGRRHAGGLRARSRPRAALLRHAPRRDPGPSSPTPRTIALARLDARVAGRAADRHPERRRPARARRARGACCTCTASISTPGAPPATRARRWTEPLIERPPCPACGERALRPDVVWFGEMPYRMDEIYAALRRADLFVSIGTSGAVYPAAGFVRERANSAPRRSNSTSSAARARPGSTRPGSARRASWCRRGSRKC